MQASVAPARTGCLELTVCSAGDGQPIIATATIELTGTFNMSATDGQWKPFTSQQRGRQAPLGLPLGRPYIDDAGLAVAGG